MREQLVEQAVTGTRRERERRGVSDPVTRDLFESLTDAQLMDLIVELARLDALYNLDRPSWEDFPQQRTREIRARTLAQSLKRDGPRRRSS